MDSASYEIGQSVQWAWIGPGGMVGRCREVLPGGIRAPGGDGFCGLADLVPEGRRRRCVPLPSRGQGRCGVGREVLGHGGTGELAEGHGDVVGHHDHEHSHVIMSQTRRVIHVSVPAAVTERMGFRVPDGPIRAVVLQQNVPTPGLGGLTGLEHRISSLWQGALQEVPGTERRLLVSLCRLDWL